MKTHLPSRLPRHLVTSPRSGFGIACLIALSAMLMPCDQDCAGDVVWLKGQTKPIYGIVDGQNETELSFKTFAKKRADEEMVTIPVTSIKMLVQNFDKERLESLSVNNPDAYYHYGEELLSQRSDPIARRLAKRLFLISAFHTKGQERIGSIKGLLALAESAKEKSEFELLMQLYDPNYTPTKTTENTQTKPSLSLDQRKALQLLVSLIRTSKTQEAQRLLQSPDMVSALALLEPQISASELLAMTKLNRINSEQLETLVNLEIEFQTGKSFGEQIRSKTWGDCATEVSTPNPLPPDLESVTDMNPKCSIFRNGSWIDPNSSSGK